MACVHRNNQTLYIVRKIKNLVLRARSYLFPKRIGNLRLYFEHVAGKQGLEIGGPSSIFRCGGLIPMYRFVKGLDGCNFSKKTTWEGDIAEGPENYRYHTRKRKGYQYLKDAVDLREITNERYDLILSSHVLEHIANPLKAISEWLRVLKPGGILLMVVPHRDGTFDHKRPVTQMQHLIDDFERAANEDDMTHFTEIMELHDLELDPAAGDVISFRQRSMKNYENRCFHHHVFNTNLVAQTVDYFRMQILDIQLGLPYHIIMLAEKVSSRGTVNNSPFLSLSAGYKHDSPFPSDIAANEKLSN